MDRWDALFADVEAQAEAVLLAERAGEIDHRTRGEIGRLRLLDRLRAGTGAEVRVSTPGGADLRGTIARVGPDWLLLDQSAGREALIGLSALTCVVGLSRASAVPDSESITEARLGLRYMLRALARDRSPVQLHLTDGRELAGTFERVGSDYVELAGHAPDEVRRRDAVREFTVVPISALAVVQRRVG